MSVFGQYISFSVREKGRNDSEKRQQINQASHDRLAVTVGSNLKADHRIVRRLESVLRVMAARISAGERLPAEDVEEAIRLMLEFVDSYHHVKEEAGLFPVIQGASKEQQKTVYAFLVEHEFGRRAARRIEQEYGSWVKGEEAAEPLAGFILTYADFIKVHTAKEDEWFDAVDGKLLSGTQQREILGRFAQVGTLGPSTKEIFGSRVKELARKYRKK
jgi:hemerythrin-like domain-containing protein